MIPVYMPSIGAKEKEYVNDCLDTSWVSSKGKYIGLFEASFAKFIGANHALSVSNGTVALHLALEALNIGPGDEVIVPTYTYVASVNAIKYVGATPVYIDSNEDSIQLDASQLEGALSNRTKAVMAVHLYGQAAPMKEISQFCEANSLKLIEDCAEAVGTQVGNIHVGSFGDIATFSFFGNKTITTGEGGMVVTNDPDLNESVYRLKTQGVDPKREYWHDRLAYNYRMTNISAAIGYAQMQRINETLQKKKAVARFYEEHLLGLPLKTHKEQKGTTHSFWMCSLLLDDPSKRLALREHLKSFGIETRPFFHPSHTLPHLREEKCYPVAEKLGASGLNLPSYPELTKAQLLFIAEKVRAFFA